MNHPMDGEWEGGGIPTPPTHVIDDESSYG